MSSRRARSGGQVDAQDVEAVVQVAPERAHQHLLAQVAVGGGDHAHVHADGLLAAHAPELALLQHAQQLGLRAQRHLADLVQEDAAAVGQLEEALAPVGWRR